MSVRVAPAWGRPQAPPRSPGPSGLDPPPSSGGALRGAVAAGGELALHPSGREDHQLWKTISRYRGRVQRLSATRASMASAVARARAARALSSVA